MYITITRYHESPDETKGEMSIDGVPFGETREPGTAAVRRRGKVQCLMRLAEAIYQCRVAPSDLSPMSLKVRRSPGQNSTFIGWDPLAPWRMGLICIGQGDPFTPPEERELTDREETFRRFTERLYKAYMRGEGFTLEIRRCIIGNLM